jgi:hypothetical protein
MGAKLAGPKLAHSYLSAIELNWVQSRHFRRAYGPSLAEIDRTPDCRRENIEAAFKTE